MISKILTAFAVASVALSSAAVASPWDPANSPRDRAELRQAQRTSDSGSAVATRGYVTQNTSVWDPANSPRDLDLRRQAESLPQQSPENFVYRAPVFDPADN